jgi:putative ABC transport system permease protein
MEGGVISLSPFDLGLAAVLVAALAALSLPLKLNLARPITVAALRMVIQLGLVALVLELLFAVRALWAIGAWALFMLLVAAREVMARQHRRFRGAKGFGIGLSSMFVSSFTVTVLALVVVIGPDPWYTPQYAIPLLGMLLGNTMNGIAVGLDRLTQNAWEQRAVIEQRLMLGQRAATAIEDIRRNATRSGMIPIINSMAAAGIVSLPGMMTGQILAGVAPMEAVKYQILVMFLITAGTGFGTVLAIWAGARSLFDERDRLRLDRLV